MAAETKHSIEALTGGAMAGIWDWVRSRIPAGVEVFDAHAHIGADVDGRTMTADGMRDRMEAAGVKRAIVFPLNDPNARDDYSGPNDVVWNAYEEHPGLFVPFFRLNPHRDYEAEFGRCVERGFMGLKLHPVSQQFELDDPRVVRLFGMAAEVGLPVLIHAGFAMQRIVEPLLPDGRGASGAAPDPRPRRDGRGARRRPRLRGAPERPLRDLGREGEGPLRALLLLDPSRVCYGSDIPYGDLPSTLHGTLAAAEAAGVPEEAVPGILSGNIRRWFA